MLREAQAYLIEEPIVMPLFKCSRCACVENTALSNYWPQKLTFDQKLAQATRPPPTVDRLKPFEPLCSECATGSWHGQFPKEQASPPKWMRGDDGFLYQRGGWKPSNVKIVDDAC